MSYVVWSDRDSIVKDALTTARFASELISTETERSIELVLKDLENIALLIKLDPSRTREFLIDLKQRNTLLIGMQIVDLNGNVLHSSSGEKFPNISQRDFIQVYSDDSTRLFYISGQARSYKYPDINFIAISQRLTRQTSEGSNIIVAYLKGKEFQNTLFPMKIPDVYQSYLITSKNHIISTDKNINNDTFIERMVSALSEDERNKGIFTPDFNSSLSKVVVAFKKIPDFKLTAATIVSTKDKFDFWYKKMFFVITVAVLWGGAILLLAYWLFKIQRELMAHAMIDPLTQLSNRLYFSDTSETLFALAVREKSPLSVAMIDIDNFKKINDSYGHNKGDQIIFSIADNMRKCCRKSDLLARLGGDEFCILMPNTNIKNAQLVIKRLQKKVSSQTHVHNTSNFKITISVGISELTEKSKNIEELLTQSDISLYYSKEHGRNKVTAFSFGEKATI